MDKDSYIRFGAWTILMLIYYVFYGVHASYDVAHEAIKGTTVKAIDHEDRITTDVSAGTLHIDHKLGTNPSPVTV